MRISSAGPILLLLVGCSPDPGSAEVSDDRLACALGGAAAFAFDCTVERRQQDGTVLLVVRHSDGAFRRFEVLRDGRGLAPADGAQAAETSISAGDLVVSVGADRYRFPATIRDAGLDKLLALAAKQSFLEGRGRGNLRQSDFDG